MEIRESVTQQKPVLIILAHNERINKALYRIDI